MTDYAKVIIKGSPITKSNFKLHNVNGRAILPNNSGKYHDRYALYEQEIALLARSQNPDIVFSESLIAILKVYYKSEKRHPDTINITKSIFDGIEKSGLIVNDAQITQIFTEEHYDSKNPRFELELFAESQYNFSYTITKKTAPTQSKLYSPIKRNLFTNDTLTYKDTLSSEVSTIDKNEIVTKKGSKKTHNTNNASKNSSTSSSASTKICSMCDKLITSADFITADSGKTLICKKCFNKLF